MVDFLIAAVVLVIMLWIGYFVLTIGLGIVFALLGGLLSLFGVGDDRRSR
jgi:hypothetical protein